MPNQINTTPQRMSNFRQGLSRSLIVGDHCSTGFARESTLLPHPSMQESRAFTPNTAIQDFNRRQGQFASVFLRPQGVLFRGTRKQF